VLDGETILLVDDITYPAGITVSGISITFDLDNQFTLTVNAPTGYGLDVDNGGEVSLVGEDPGTAEFNVSGVDGGVRANNSGKAAVSNATASGTGSRGVSAFSGATVKVTGDATASGADCRGAYALYDATIEVGGNATGSGTGSRGVHANGANTSVTVGGNATGEAYGVGAWYATVIVTGNATTASGTNGRGVYASGANTSVTIGGNAEGGSGVEAFSSATVKVTGNVTGDYDGVYAVSFATVEVTGNVTGVEYGVTAANGSIFNGGATVKVTGNVTATGATGTGVYAADANSSVTIDGIVAGTTCIVLNGVSKAAGDYAASSSKAGYFEYADGVSAVWVKDPLYVPPTPPAPKPTVASPHIAGPASMTLTVGYAATSTDAYTITGASPVTVTITSGDSRIRWDNATKRLDIAAGLPTGTYAVVLRATNNASSYHTFTFTLKVEAVVYYLDIPATFVGGAVAVKTNNPNPYLSEAGDRVTLTATPDAGYVLGNIVVCMLDNTSIVIPLSGSGNTFTFTMPANHVAIMATFRTTVGVETHCNASLQAFVQNGILYVSGAAEGATVKVYNITGTLIASPAPSQGVDGSPFGGVGGGFPLPGRGVYIVHSGNEAIKVVY